MTDARIDLPAQISAYTSAPCQAHGANGFWSRVDRSGGPDACWPWLGAINQKGYGRRYHEGKDTTAHRVALLLSGQSIPDGYTVDHLCRNRLCQNPHHLEAVSHQTNVLRGDTLSAAHARRTVCANGHRFDGLKEGYRFCLACHREIKKRRRILRFLQSQSEGM